MTDQELSALDRERACARAVEAARRQVEVTARALCAETRWSEVTDRRTTLVKALAALDAAREALRAAEAVPR